MKLYKIKDLFSTQSWFNQNIYTLISVDKDKEAPYYPTLGKDAKWLNVYTNEQENMFHNILEELSKEESIPIIRELKLSKILYESL